MQRTKNKKPPIADAILSADIHLTESTPISRTDDYLAAQKKKLNFLRGLQEEHNCPVIDAGDVFDHWKPSPWLLRRAYECLPKEMITIPGNHDLPEHSLELYYKSGLALLDAYNTVKVLLFRGDTIHHGQFEIQGIPYGEYEQEDYLQQQTTISMLILHEMIWPSGNQPWPGAEGYTAEQILKNHPNHKLIVTGHHHRAFTVKKDNQLLVNPGSMMRASADKAEYHPRVYLYYSKSNSVIPVYYPIEKDVHNTEHLIQSKEREKRLTAYIKKMNMKWDVNLSFEHNLESFFTRNKTPKAIKELIYTNLEKGAN
jgi:DNA repair exonuclease SbcCD nuclease subunit